MDRGTANRAYYLPQDLPSDKPKTPRSLRPDVAPTTDETWDEFERIFEDGSMEIDVKAGFEFLLKRGISRMTPQSTVDALSKITELVRTKNLDIKYPKLKQLIDDTRNALIKKTIPTTTGKKVPDFIPPKDLRATSVTELDSQLHDALKYVKKNPDFIIQPVMISGWKAAAMRITDDSLRKVCLERIKEIEAVVYPEDFETVALDMPKRTH